MINLKNNILTKKLSYQKSTFSMNVNVINHDDIDDSENIIKSLCFVSSENNKNDSSIIFPFFAENLYNKLKDKK